MINIFEYFDNKDIEKDEFLNICNRFLFEIDEVLILEEGNRIKVKNFLVNKIKYLSTYTNTSKLENYLGSIGEITAYSFKITTCLICDIHSMDEKSDYFFIASWLYLHYSIQIKYYALFGEFSGIKLSNNSDIKSMLIQESKSYYYGNFTHKFIQYMDRPGTEMDIILDQYVDMIKFEVEKSILPRIYLENKINELIKNTDINSVKKFYSKNILDYYKDGTVYLESDQRFVSNSMFYFETEIPDKFIYLDDLIDFEHSKYFLESYTYLQSLYQEYTNKIYITQDDWLNALNIINNREDVDQKLNEKKAYAPRYLFFGWLLHKNILKFEKPNQRTSALVDFKIRLSSVIKSRKSVDVGKEISTLKNYIKESYPNTYTEFNKTIYDNYLKKLEYTPSYKPTSSINLNNGVSHDFFDYLHDKLLKEFILVSKKDFIEFFIIDPSSTVSIPDHLYFLFNDFPLD